MTPDNATPERMTPDSAATILRQHNAWRRHNGDEPMDMQSPLLVGEAIDVAVAFIGREYETTEQAA